MKKPMAGYPRFLAGVLAALAAAQLVLVAGASAQTLMGEADATAAVETEYGVEVLDVEEDTVDGTPVFRVTVMNPAGDFNEAFLVSTLIVDRRTGGLVPQYRQGSQGAELPGPARRAGE